MKLAVSSYSLSRWRSQNKKTLDDSMKWVADAGVGAIEFSGLDEKAKDNPIGRARQVRQKCQKLGLQIVGYSVGGELLVAPDQQRAAVAKLKQEVEVAAELGVKNMRHDVTRGFANYTNFKGPQSFSNALKVIVPALREIAEHGAKLGVKTSLENHGFYMQESARVEKLILAVNHPNYGLTMDMGNFLCVNEEPVSAVARVAKYAIMVHVKDFHVRLKKQVPPSGWFATPTPIALRGAIVGHGEVDVPAQLKLLKKAKYNGYLSLEFEGMEEPTQAITLGLEYLQSEFKKLGL